MNHDLVRHYDALAPLAGSPPLRIAEAHGAAIKTEDGKTYIDLNEICVLLGQGNQRFARAIMEALEYDIGKSTVHKDRLYQHLVETTNDDFARILLTSSGSEAVEYAVRLARKRTGRCEIVAFWNSVHGRTFLASSLSGLPARKTGYGPLAPGILHTPYPYCYRCPHDRTPDTCGFRCLEFLGQKVEAESSQDIAAVLIEPMQGAGIIIPPHGYLQALRRWTAEHGIELIFDEIQSALGRLGQIYQYQEAEIVPDMLLLGKGLGNGLHIAALLMKGQVPSENLRYMAGGSGDLPLGCAAACSVFEELADGKLLASVNAVGAYLRQALESLCSKYSCIGDVRGQGVAFAVEFVTDRASKQHDFGLSGHVAAELRRQGFLVGTWQSSIVLRPPLSLTLGQAEAFVHSLEAILGQQSG